ELHTFKDTTKRDFVSYDKSTKNKGDEQGLGGNSFAEASYH
ncbi:hypothetical protein HMPREF3226_02903, partial [Prevotella corporis]